MSNDPSYLGSDTQVLNPLDGNSRKDPSGLRNPETGRESEDDLD